MPLFTGFGALRFGVFGVKLKWVRIVTILLNIIFYQVDLLHKF